MKIFYTTRATATGGRSGHTALDDGSLAFDLVVPGSGKSGANPEQLFALGYAACFDSALELTAKKLKLPLAGSHNSPVPTATSSARPPTMRSPTCMGRRRWAGGVAGRKSRRVMRLRLPGLQAGRRCLGA